MPTKGSTSARGYGTAHQKLRAKYKRMVDAGRATCARCGLPIPPGTRWDLGHVDGTNKTQYAGPEHVGRECPLGGNRATRGRVPVADQPGTVNPSRRW